MPDKPKQKDERKAPHEKPISLHPMTTEEALKKALQTKPDHQDHGKQPKTKK